MSFQALNAALSGLRVAQQQLNVISNNVANVGTAGYTRKTLPQSTQVINATGQSIGVRAELITRNVDLDLARDLWTQISAVSQLDVKASYLERISKFHGPPDQELSIAAEISALKDDFAALSDTPDGSFLQQSVLNQAGIVADKFNDFGALLIQQRNDVQDEMIVSVDRINDLLNQIAELNQEIRGAVNVNRLTANLEDQRDEAIKALSEEIDISFFIRGDGVLVVQAASGIQLADERASEIFFDPLSLSPQNFYPDNAAGIFVGGDPATNINAIDITTEEIGGRLQGLIELRDQIFPEYQAQIDELAHKLALRFDAQGLRLFTDPTGNIPLDTAPDPTAGPPALAVEYVGFSNTIQVNQSIVSDPTLLQQGTYTSDITIPAGSNEVIRRVLEHTFGDVDVQQAAGTIDLNIAAPATDLQEWLGLFSQNNVTFGIDLGSFSEIDDGVVGTADLIEDLQTFFPNYPADDQLQITFEEPRTGLGPTTITLDLSDADANFPLGGGINDALDQIIAEINSQIALAGVPAGLDATATRNVNGQLVIQSRGNITVDASSFAGSMGSTAVQALGIAEGSFTTEDPYFDVQVGNNDPVRITIEPGDTAADLVNKLEYDVATQTGVPGLFVDLDAGTGQLTIRPGIDDSNGGPQYGGDMRIIAGPFSTNAPVNPTLAALPDNVGVVSAIFGSFTVSGATISEFSPITDIPYQSEISNGSGTFVDFRSQFLGPAANISTDILSATSITDFAQKVVNDQTQDLILAESQIGNESTLRDLLQRQMLDESAVNIDEELSNLILVQTAFAASARAVTAAEELFDELLNAVR